MRRRRDKKAEEGELEGEPHPSGRKTLGQQITGGRGCSAQLQCKAMEMHGILFTGPVSNLVVQSIQRKEKELKLDQNY